MADARALAMTPYLGIASMGAESRDWRAGVRWSSGSRRRAVRPPPRPRTASGSGSRRGPSLVAPEGSCSALEAFAFRDGQFVYADADEPTARGCYVPFGHGDRAAAPGRP